MECQFLSQWYDSTPKKSRRKDTEAGTERLIQRRMMRGRGGFPRVRLCSIHLCLYMRVLLCCMSPVLCVHESERGECPRVRLCKIHSYTWGCSCLEYLPSCACKMIAREAEMHVYVLCIHLYRLVGLVVKAPASRTEAPGFESRLRRDFSGSSHTTDL